MEKETKRNYNYDVIRIIATALVILCHSTETIYFANKNISPESNLFFITFHSISRLAVPFFLFLTGALLLNKNFDNKEEIKKFYKHNLTNLIIACEIWYILYYFIDRCILGEPFQLKDFIQVMLFLKPYPLSHAWYLPIIIGIYITIPFVSIIVKKYSKYVKYIMYVNIFYVFVIPMINLILNLINLDYQLINKININFIGSYYEIYILLGYYISKNYNNEKYNKKIYNYILIAISILSLMATIFIRYKLKCDSWYNMLTILICSSSIFTLILRSKVNHFGKLLVTLSTTSFGVYLIHKLIINLLKQYNFVNELHLRLPMKTFLYCIITFINSYIIIILLSKIKYLRRYLLFIK